MDIHCIPVSNYAFKHSVSSIPMGGMVSTKSFEFLPPLRIWQYIGYDVLCFATWPHFPPLCNCISGDNNCILQYHPIHHSKPEFLHYKVHDMTAAAKTVFLCVIVMFSRYLFISQRPNQCIIVARIVPRKVSQSILYSILLLKLTNNPGHVRISMRSFKQAKSNYWVPQSPCMWSEMRKYPKNCHSLMETGPTITRKMDMT